VGLSLVFVAVSVIVFGKGLAPPDPPPGVDLQQVEVPDPGHRPLPLLLWQPRAGTNTPGAVIVISHGAGGSKVDHADTAMALAQAGFVVAAIEHAGDNYRDSSGRLPDRPRQVVRVLDYLLGEWSGRSRIDAGRIGIFGFSAGGFTALVLAGAEPDLSRGGAYCRQRPLAWTCAYLRQRGIDPSHPAEQPAAWVHDPRIRAAAIVAPAIGYSFTAPGLANVRLPIQLWTAQDDQVVEDSPALIANLLPTKPVPIVAPSAGHFAFMAPCSWQKRLLIRALHSLRGTEEICSDALGFDRPAFHAKFNRKIVDFFTTQLGVPLRR